MFLKRCQCGSKNIQLQFGDKSIKLVCANCGASASTDAKSILDEAAIDGVKQLWNDKMPERKATFKEPKQVIVLRYKYPDGKGGLRKIRMGKLVAQACHASSKVFFDRTRCVGGTFSGLPGECLDGKGRSQYEIELTSEMDRWMNSRLFTKVVVGVTSEEELVSLQQQADKMGLPNALITDLGLTEFNGEPTKTCLAIGPDEAECIDQITGNLELL